MPVGFAHQRLKYSARSLAYCFQVMPSSRHKANLLLDTIAPSYLPASRGTTSLTNILDAPLIKKQHCFQWVTCRSGSL